MRNVEMNGINVDELGRVEIMDLNLLSQISGGDLVPDEPHPLPIPDQGNPAHPRPLPDFPFPGPVPFPGPIVVPGPVTGPGTGVGDVVVPLPGPGSK